MGVPDDDIGVSSDDDETKAMISTEKKPSVYSKVKIILAKHFPQIFLSPEAYLKVYSFEKEYITIFIIPNRHTEFFCNNKSPTSRCINCRHNNS